MKRGLETLIEKLEIYSVVMEIEFGIDKYTMHMMESGRKQMGRGETGSGTGGNQVGVDTGKENSIPY